MSLLVVLSWMVVAAAAVPAPAPAGFFDTVGDTFKKETSALTNPVVATVVNITTTQCEPVKKLLGVSYQQMARKDPDLDKLTLNYVTKDLNVTLNINSAAKLLPKSPTFNDEYFVIYFHGFTDNPKKSSFGTISNAFLSKGLYNILALDSSPYIGYFYLRSTTYVKFIGEKMGTILAQLVRDGLPPQSIHLVGHSLGAHIAGFSAKQFNKETGELVGRVTGMDPAGPCFSQLDSEHKLAANDAAFVDAIHTDGGVFGMKDPCAQVDFFPNDGVQQPGCLIDTCSHSRAWELMAESILNATAFVGAKCHSWEEFKKGNCSGTSLMGLPTTPGTTGRYYLQTANSSPYGLGERGAKYENNEAFIKNLFG